MSMVTATRQEMMYCPGCSHAAVLEQLGAALDRLGLPPEQVCLVSDIGCIGTADRYFACHTFHGLHGRSVTYAEAIKRCRPDLLVIVLIGDGGCGIGTAHLVHTARRGVGVKVFVCNNFNFGMTGGQHSPTTPAGGVTATTPTGAGDRPLDVCQLVIASGGAFVARCSAFDRNLPEMIDATLRAPGFALLDIWELCTAYYMPTNKLNPPKLVEMSRELGMPFGILKNEPARTDGRAAAALDADTGPAVARPGSPPTPLATDRPRFDVRSGLRWPQRVEIALAGSAGERIRSAAGVIGEILVAAGLQVAQLDDYPITVRKGFSLSNLIVARQPIRYTGLRTPELVIIQSEDGLRRFGSLVELPPQTLVIVNDELTWESTPARVQPVTLAPLIRQVERANVALALLAHGLIQCGWITAEALRNLADATLKGRFREANLRAIEAGVTLESSPAARS